MANFSVKKYINNFIINTNKILDTKKKKTRIGIL